MSLHEQSTDSAVDKTTNAILDPNPSHVPEEQLNSSSSDESKKPAATPTTESGVDKSPEKVMEATDDDEYPPPAAAAVVMVAICLALFLVALDRTIIATAIPKMTDDFHSLNDIGWYGSVFLLTACTFQLVLGRVYTFYPPKQVFLATILGFEIGSAICGAAPTSTTFIVGRAIAGIGSAGVMSGAIVLMTNTIPLASRPKYQGLFGATFGVASIAGPLLGGVFTSKVSWRWCFYINLPIGAVTIIIIALILKPIEPKRGDFKLTRKLALLDPLGNLFLTPSIVCLLLALQWGGSTYAWSNGRIVALLVLFVAFLLAFVLVQIFRQDTAMIPAHIIKQRSVLAAMWFTFTIGSAMMLMVYYVPIWFQAIKGVTAVQSGIDTIPMVLSLVVGTIVSGFTTSKIGYYTPSAYIAVLIMPVGAGLISTWTPSTGHAMWIAYQVLLGLGLGLGMQQGNMAVQTVLNKADVPSGISLVVLTQMLGGAVFISVGQNILQTQLVKGLVQYGVDPQTVVRTGATQIRNLIPAAQLGDVLTVYNYSLRQTYLCATGLACAALLGAAALEWKSVKAPEKGTKSAIEAEKRKAESDGEIV